MKKQQIEKVKKLELVVFEKKLQSMAEEGEFDFVMDESLEGISENEIKPATLFYEDFRRFYQTVEKASNENALIDACKKTPVTTLSFGRHLQLIRDQSGLSQPDIAKLLNKDPSYIENIENGRFNPLDLLVDDLADIMQLFRLTLAELKTTIKAFLTLSTQKTIRASAMARSSSKIGTKERGDGLSHAMDAALQAINKKTTKIQEQDDKIEINPKYLEDIQKVLKERGETELLV